MKDPQQTADELVEKYRECDYTDNSYYGCVSCAILHTQGIIDEICYQAKSTGGRMFGKLYTNLRLKFHQQVLTILKTRL